MDEPVIPWLTPALGGWIRCQPPRSAEELPTFPYPPALRTHVRTATTVGRGSAALSLVLPHTLLGTPTTERPGTVARQSRQLTNDDLNTAVMLGFRRFPQEYKAQSVPPAILTPGPP